MNRYLLESYPSYWKANTIQVIHEYPHLVVAAIKHKFCVCIRSPGFEFYVG